MLYKLKYDETFVGYDDRYHIEGIFKNVGEIPKNQIRQNEKYYRLYVNNQGNFRDCVLGKVGWIENCGKNMEWRKLRSVNPEDVVKYNPDIIILNKRSEWENWYYNLVVGKWNKVMLSESCLRDCLSSCLDEVVVSRNGRYPNIISEIMA